MGHVGESSLSSSTSERMIIYGDEYRCIDQNCSLVYNSKWFIGMPSMFDIVGQNFFLTSGHYMIIIYHWTLVPVNGNAYGGL